MRNNVPFLIVFIDALSYGFIKKNNGKLININSFSYEYKLLPTAGYSSNIHWLLFANRKPDDLNYFTDWNIVGEKADRSKKNICLKSLSFIDKVDYFSDTLRIFLRYSGLIKNNLPFSEINLFENKAIYFFNQSKNTKYNLFRKKFLFIDYDKHKRKIGLIIENAKNEKINIFIFSRCLDEIGHLYGPESNQYKNYTENLFKCLEIILTKVLKEAKYNVILISDHGMTEIKSYINILKPLYLEFGYPGEDYIIYCDSVYLRVWSKYGCLIEKIRRYLSSIEIIKILTEEERRMYGIRKVKFGNLICVLKEGYAFNPNHFGLIIRKYPRGMHGYLDRSDNNTGLILANIKLFNEREIYPWDFYDKLFNLLI